MTNKKYYCHRCGKEVPSREEEVIFKPDGSENEMFVIVPYWCADCQQYYGNYFRDYHQSVSFDPKSLGIQVESEASNV